MTDATTDRDMVIRTGKIFEAGFYEDKNYGMTPEELLAATVDFAPVPIDSGHPSAPSPLDGKLGEVRTIAVDKDGKTLLGTVAWPKWLDDLIPEADRKVSAQWDRATKRLKSLSLVQSPRISDAALYAAFASHHDTKAGQSAIQELHDLSAKHGAGCTPADSAPFASRHEENAIQDIHDTTVKHGGSCPPGATASMSTANEPVQKGKVMGWLQDLKHAFANVPDDVDPATFSGNATAVAQPIQGAPATTLLQSTGPAFDPEKDSLKAELARERAHRIESDAKAFFSYITEIKHKAMPGEETAILEGYTQAAKDDINFGVASFSDGKTRSRVDIFKNGYEARPSTDQLMTEQISEANFAALVNRMQTPKHDPNAPPSEARLNQLLEMTAMGSAHLRGRNGAN